MAVDVVGRPQSSFSVSVCASVYSRCSKLSCTKHKQTVSWTGNQFCSSPEVLLHSVSAPKVNSLASRVTVVVCCVLCRIGRVLHLPAELPLCLIL